MVVISTGTLFAEGVTRRLQLKEETLTLRIVDTRSEDPMGQILAINPDAVIVDASDSEANLICPINQLLAKIPELKIIRLDPELSGFQVVKSARHTASEVDDLVEAIIGGA